MGKRSRLIAAGWECDEKVGSDFFFLVDGM